MPESGGTALDCGGLRVSILTTERQPSYVHDTLSSLLGSSASVVALGSIDLMIDADEASGYLSGAPARSDAQAALSQRRGVACSEHAPSRPSILLQLLAQPQCDHGRYWGLVVLEDDVLLREAFVEKLILTVEEVRRRQGVERVGPKGLQQFMLALYSTYDFAREPGFYRGHYYCSYGYPFYGTCGMFYEASIVPLVRDYMWRFGVESHRLPGDLLLNELKASGTLWVYACTRDLVQHVGIVSSGLGAGGAVFRSRTFDRAWGPVRRREWATA